MDTSTEPPKINTVHKSSYFYFRFLNCSEKWTNELKNHIDKLITNYVEDLNQSEEIESIITHITEMESASKKDMLNIFNSISNYHWIDYPRFQKGKWQKDNSTCYSSHLLLFPEHRDRINHLPTSPRL